MIWITPKWPLPATDGARIATTQLLRHLTSSGVSVHLCALVPAEEAASVDIEAAKRELGVGTATVIPRRAPGRARQLLNLFLQPFFPITLFPYADRAVRDEVHGFLAGRHYDWVVYDGLHAGGWSLTSQATPELLRLVEGREVYRAHNVESEIWFAGARETRNPLKKALLAFQGMLVRTLETKLLLRARYTFPVSFDDETKFRQHRPEGVLKTLPIGVRVPTPLRVGQKVDKAATALAREGRKLLFVGKLDWPPNRDGLKWLLTHVWPQAIAKAPDLRLTIVGSGERSWLEPFRGLPGVEIVGRVDDLVPYYEACIATLIPVFYGSGVRVKAIESSLFGRVPVSTRLGVEGMGLTPGDHYLRAETVEEWVRTLVRLNPEAARRMGERARAHARVVFDPDQVARTFVETVGLKETAHAQ